MSKVKQIDRIVDYIKQNGSITQIEALNALGVMRLASRVSDMKKQGYPVVASTCTVTNRFGETCHIKKYSLAEEQI